jgi:hypothetical protein
VNTDSGLILFSAQSKYFVITPQYCKEGKDAFVRIITTGVKNAKIRQSQWLVPVIPATWEAEIRKITTGGQSKQKVSKATSQQTSQAWWYTSVIPVTQEA